MSKLNRSIYRLLGLSLAVWSLAAWPAYAADSASATIAVNVQVHARTVLRVSTTELRFDLPTDRAVATAALEFSAAARTGRDAEVVLTVECLRALEGPGGAADVDSLVTFAGEGEGTIGGQIDSLPVVAGRWLGSGRRDGQLRFTLHAGVPGTYQVPVRLVLTAP